ncbi:MAG TPA: M28 family peptidase [Longimicrobiales bacterium]|nr:M28 family peptidase [Longimicrobiales bacterium]
MSGTEPPPRDAVLEMLRSLAVPRLHGSAAAAGVQARIRAEFERIGLAVEDCPFTFSALPGRFGAQICGVILAVTLPAAAFFVQAGRFAPALAFLLAPAILAATAVMLSDAAMLRLPFARAAGANMLAGSGAARFLIVAHRDSKSQPMPLILRVGGAVGAVLAWLTLVAIVAANGQAPAVATTAGIIGGICGLVISRCCVGNDSDGALDNASGVAGLLRIARIEADRGSHDVAFLVTDAEEFGLVGARVAAASFPDVEAVINLDGLDDDGPIVLIDGRSPLASPPSRLTWTLDQCATERDAQVRHRGLPPGLLLDHVPFSRAGHHAVTIMRGRLRSLARVHRPGDTADRMDGRGATLVADIVSDALDVIRTDPATDRALRVAREPAPG